MTAHPGVGGESPAGPAASQGLQGSSASPSSALYSTQRCPDASAVCQWPVVCQFVSGTMSGQALYVGGLDEAVTLDLLRAAFLPFGHVKDAQLPLDAQGAHKGFAFIEFEAEEDAQAAIDNMEGAELFGRTIRVNPARGGGGGGSGGGAGGGRGRAVWAADAEGWYKNLKAQGKKAREDGGGEEVEEEGEGEGAGREGGEVGAAAASGGGGGSSAK